jgi:hypothetical protein
MCYVNNSFDACHDGKNQWFLLDFSSFLKKRGFEGVGPSLQDFYPLDDVVCRRCFIDISSFLHYLKLVQQGSRWGSRAAALGACSLGWLGHL